MNLLCPNCQKPLTVPEQYAGQPMRCPLCAGTFTVPALPQAPAPPPPPAAPPDVYGMQGGAAPPASAPHMDVPAVEPSPVTGTPPPPRPPAGLSWTYPEERPTFPTTPMPEGYQRRYTTWFSPVVLQYVAPAAVFLVFVLSFFSWTGIYPGGVAWVTQNMWWAAFGLKDVDRDIGDPFQPSKDEQPTPVPIGGADFKPNPPGFNFLLLFYLLLLFPTLVVTAACLALPFLPANTVPPALHIVLPWRWGILAGLNLILLLFLGLQLVFGFSLENNFIGAADSAIAKSAPPSPTTPQARAIAIERGVVRQAVSRTIWLDLVVFFHILAILAAGMMFWLNRRGGRPAPRIDLLW